MNSKSRNILAAAFTAVWAAMAGAATLEDGAQARQESAEPGTGKIPKVELYMNQQPLTARAGEPLTVPITGAVYDFPLLVGDIALAPNNTLPIGSNNPACPIFFSGSAFNIGAPIGQNVLSVPLTVFVPPTTAPGTYNCALKYQAVYKSPFTGISYSVGKGNQVNVPYTIKVRR